MDVFLGVSLQTNIISSEHGYRMFVLMLCLYTEGQSRNYAVFIRKNLALSSSVIR